MAKESTNATKTGETKTPQRLHRAAYTRDKKNPGQWLVRVSGPHAKEFEGREVPVTVNGGGEQIETLARGVFAGIDDGKINPADKGQNYCLYQIVPKPKATPQEVEF